MRLRFAGTVALIAALAAPSSALAQTGGTPAPTRVDANGNVFLGGLSFTPAAVTVPVGGSVQWTNTDFLVPHTATEDHGLWDLGGSYGATPANPPGFGPGKSVSRKFEAGVHGYYCRVHPQQMKGKVTVNPTLRRQRVRVTKRVLKRVKRKHRKRGQSRYVRKRVKRRVTRRYVVATWATMPPAPGEAYDVERRYVGGTWHPLSSGPGATSARFRVHRGVLWEVRARLRDASDASRATGWASAKVTG
jgi:plastocyanin